MQSKVYQTVLTLLDEVENTQQENIEKAAQLFKEAIKKGGLLQGFGSGHSNSGAAELCNRAGGFIPTKQIKEPSGGIYEGIEGVGTAFMKRVDIKDTDCVVIISNSGRNPLPIELAIEAKKRGASVVAITSVEASKKLKSKHSGGKNLWELADVVLDNCVPDGDACIDIDGLDTKICGMSSITTAVLIQETMYRATELLLEEGIVPPVFKSNNVDGGFEYNQALREKYFDRIWHM